MVSFCEEFTPTFTLCSHHDTVKETGAQHGHFTLGGGAPGANSRFQYCATHPTNCSREPVTFLGGGHHHLHFTDEKGKGGLTHLKPTTVTDLWSLSVLATHSSNSPSSQREAQEGNAVNRRPGGPPSPTRAERHRLPPTTRFWVCKGARCGW